MYVLVYYIDVSLMMIMGWVEALCLVVQQSLLKLCYALLFVLMRHYAFWCDHTGKVSDMRYSLEEDSGGRCQ